MFPQVEGSRAQLPGPMGLGPILGANFAAVLMGAKASAPPAFQYQGTPNIEFFLMQCRARETG